MHSIEFIRFNNWQVSLDDWSVIEVKGLDSIQFLNGQTTNDLKNIQSNQAILTARLNHHGLVQSFFYVAKNDSEVYLFSPAELALHIITDLSKFIIMEDVELNLIDKQLYFQHQIKNQNIQNVFNADFFEIKGSFSFEEEKETTLINKSELDLIQKLNGFPVWNKNIFSSHLVNETRLNTLAVSYKKGCFLGQETAAKIENNRGPATFPFLIKLNGEVVSVFDGDIKINEEKIGTYEGHSRFNDESFLHVRLKREYRVDSKKIDFEINQKKFSGIVITYPLFKNKTAEEKSMELFDSAVKIFNRGDVAKALDLINRSISVFETPDNVEIKGVILGRLERFEEAIIEMDRLTALDPRSVMAHTNKSLFLMRLGKIEAAEEEKSLATVKSFERFGEEAKIKRQLAEEKKKKEEELFSREKMFLKVLEIDQEDAIANFGMGDINFHRGKFIDSINYLNVAIKSNPNYSTAYLMLGKAYEALVHIEAAKETYQAGIVVATKRGDMMPANEMQARLNQL